MVEIKNLTKYYGSNPAVQDISFTVGDHEVLGFLGPNGAGKSTTMNMITGCLPSTSGTVLVDGYDIAKDPLEVKRRIGYLPELPPVYTDMRVRDYLMFAAGLKGVPRDKREKQVKDAMERLHITDVQKRIIGNLSKGYRQRVGFAQALLGSPKFLILDEPTVGLDPKQVMEVRRLIKELAKDHTIIFSTHILAEVTAVCERVVIISQGRIRAVDTIENLENSIGGEKQLRMKIEGEITKVTDIINGVAGVTGISEVEYESDGVSSFTVSVTSEDVRKPLMAALIAEDCMVLEVTAVHANLEDVFVRLTAPSREDAIADLHKELETARAAEKAAEAAADAESEKEADD
ncbi:MAG: ABC transporter ATP-binding protein [Oscillospiraceae bacterium]|nr:ABC transporter ATP-binding protein [Oscillospiraceae bacterium]MBR5723195.1 ABC transporter ATP-binding protein [Oscillospiraceae bacterium]